MKNRRFAAFIAAALLFLSSLTGCNGKLPESSESQPPLSSTPDLSSDERSQPTPSDDNSESTSESSDSSSPETSSATTCASTDVTAASTPETVIDTTTAITTTPSPITSTTTAATTTAATTTTPPATTTVSQKPSPPYIVTPTASGKTVYENDKAVIDASNASQGYIMVKLKEPDPENEYKILIDSPDGSDTYLYVLNNNSDYETIPLTCSSGTYTVDILKVLQSGKGTRVFKKDIAVTIEDSFAPFLSPNQYCNYNSSSNCVLKASEICAGCNEIEKIEKIYKFVLAAMEYKITSVNSADGYVPDPDRALRNGYGVCFDYATLMAAMLRSQKLPTKVVVGYAGTTYHAWISIYVSSVGWIDGIINFDGNTWKRMDPTYADSARDDEDYKYLINYIQNPSNYTDMFYY